MQDIDIGSAFFAYWSMFVDCLGSFFSHLSSIRIYGVSLLDISVTFFILGIIISVFVVVNRAEAVSRFRGFTERRKTKDE